VESTNPAFGRAVVRVNVYRHHRQTVQYIQPQHHAKLAQAELLVIDEAAAIPLPLVKAMLGPYLVFLCSTGAALGAAVPLRRPCTACLGS
jgi:N-acetyltransferase 10